jgi:hypothetical protein
LNPPKNPEWFIELNASPPTNQTEGKRLAGVTSTNLAAIRRRLLGDAIAALVIASRSTPAT